MKKLSAYIYPPTILQRARYSIDSVQIPDLLLRTILVISYLCSCIRYRALPWRYFQMNSSYFNGEKGIYSKLDIDEQIPVKNRLKQYPIDASLVPDRFPVFIKPEWGQNSNGIVCAHTRNEFIEQMDFRNKENLPYIVQEAASGKKEFEIYYLRSPDQFEQYSFLSITRVINKSSDPHPINSIHNQATYYRDITKLFNKAEKDSLWEIIGSMGDFRMARVGVKADSRSGLLKGDFKVIEINLFLPMPLVLLSSNVQVGAKLKIIGNTMGVAARLVKTLRRDETGKWIFFRKMRTHYKIVS